MESATKQTENNNVKHIWGTNSLKVFLAKFFNKKIPANRLAMVGMAGGRLGGQAASTIRLKFRLKFCFLTITQMLLNGIDQYLDVIRYICKVLHKARIITLLRVLSKLSPLEFGYNFG